MAKKALTLGDIVTPAEARLITLMFQALVSRVDLEVITPALPRINAVTGQENDARFLAYMVLVAIVTQVDDIAQAELNK